MKLINFFSCTEAYYVKRQDFSKLFFEKLAFYGLDIEPQPEPELVESRNRNYSKVGTGTGTVKDSYSSTTLYLTEVLSRTLPYKLSYIRIITSRHPSALLN
jgi:hypothetical protein